MKKYFFKNYILIFFLKIITLIYFGPQLMPDSNGYIDESKDLLESLPFRNYGYPIIISILNYFDHWKYLLVLIQIFVTFLTSFVIFKTSLDLKLSKGIAFFVIIFFNFSILFFLDLCILPDSLITNFFTIILCNFISLFLRNKNVYGLFLLNSLLFIFCFFLKSQLIYYLPIFIVILISLIRVIKLKDFLIGCLIFILPIFIIAESVKVFHFFKFNQKVISPSDNTIYLYSLIKPYKDFNMQNLNSINDDFNLVLRSNINSEEFMVTYDILSDLKQRGFSDTEISDMIKNKYLETVFQNPEFFFIRIAYNLKPTFIWGMFQPFLNYSQIYSVKAKDQDYWRFRLLFSQLLSNFDIFNLILLLFIFLEMIIATYIFFFVLINSLKQYFKYKNFILLRTTSKNEFLISLVIFYFVFILLHLIVHVEPRYMAPVNIIPLIYFFYKKKIKD